MLNPKLRYLVCGAALVLSASAAEVWNSKDPKDWTEADVQKVLTNSPWAQKASAASQGDPGRSRRGGSGGIGGGGGGIGGGGIGGGGRFPSTPGIGGGYPQTGGNNPNGGRGGSRYPGNDDDTYPSGSGSGRERADVVIRWDSALPVQDALAKSQPAGDSSAGNSADAPNKSGKDYIITVIGLRAPRPTGSDNDDESDTQSSRRSRLMESTQLQIKNKSSISPEDVKFDAPGAAPGSVQFLFPRANPIDLDDKEVTFVTQQGRLKIEHKFKLKEMVFNGKLSL